MTRPRTLINLFIFVLTWSNSRVKNPAEFFKGVSLSGGLVVEYVGICVEEDPWRKPEEDWCKHLIPMLVSWFVPVDENTPAREKPMFQLIAYT